MEGKTVISAIMSRRSIRKYLDKDIPMDTLEKILDAGRWAPSGLNNQPWRFSIIKSRPVKEKLSELTKYSRIIRECNACVAVFYSLETGYQRDKDMMGIGACIQNMLLFAHEMGIGCVWLGEILANKDEARKILGVDDGNELVAVIAMGYPDESPRSSRESMDKLRLRDFL